MNGNKRSEYTYTYQIYNLDYITRAMCLCIEKYKRWKLVRKIKKEKNTNMSIAVKVVYLFSSVFC